MDIKNKFFSLTLVFLAIIIFLSFSMYKCLKENTVLKEALPYLLPGEKVNFIHLINVAEPAIIKKDLRVPRLSLIFIMPKSSCVTCNKNMIYWQKYADIFAESIDVYGIVLGNLSEASNFSQDAKLNFPLFVPENLNSFARQFRIKFGYSQTIICKGNEIQHIQFGDLDGEMAVKIIKFIKELK